MLQPVPGSAADTFALDVAGSYFRVQGFVLQGAEGAHTTNVYVEGAAHHIEIDHPYGFGQ